MNKVLIIGPSVERTKGGMATVIQSQFDSNPAAFGFELEHLTTHVDGNKLEKLFFFIRSVTNLIIKRGISITHIHVASGASFYRKSVYLYICLIKRIPVIMHVHGHEFDQFFMQSSSAGKRYIRSTFQFCKRVLVLSSYWYEFFHKNILQSNIEILYNGVDLTYFSSCKTSADQINKFLFLGRLGQRKGVYDLLDAVNILVNDRHYTDIYFYLAGDGELEKVTSVIQQYNLSNNVFLLGWLDGKLKKESLQKVYTVILPSYSEGLPMSLLEAMASGKVVISTRVGGIPELIHEGRNGFLVCPGDVNGLVENILHVLSNKDEMKMISASNVEKIQCDYDIVKLNQRLYNLYNQLIEPAFAEVI